MKEKFYFIDVSPGESEDYVFSLEAERETFDSMCELVRRNLITTLDEQSVTAGTYQTVEQTVKTGSFEAAPLDEPATETLNFLADIDSGRGNHPIYVAFEDDYYVLDFHYRSGE